MFDIHNILDTKNAIEFWAKYNITYNNYWQASINNKNTKSLHFSKNIEKSNNVTVLSLLAGLLTFVDMGDKHGVPWEILKNKDQKG